LEIRHSRLSCLRRPPERCEHYDVRRHAGRWRNSTPGCSLRAKAPDPKRLTHALGVKGHLGGGFLPPGFRRRPYDCPQRPARAGNRGVESAQSDGAQRSAMFGEEPLGVPWTTTSRNSPFRRTSPGFPRGGRLRRAPPGPAIRPVQAPAQIHVFAVKEVVFVESTTADTASRRSRHAPDNPAGFERTAVRAPPPALVRHRTGTRRFRPVMCRTCRRIVGKAE